MMSSGAVYILYLLGTLALGFLGGWLVARDRYILKLSNDVMTYYESELTSSKEEEVATNYFALGYYYSALDKSYKKHVDYRVYGSSFSSEDLIVMGSRLVYIKPDLDIYVMHRLPETPTS